MHDREIEQVIATKQPIRGEVPFTGTHGRRIYDYIFVPVIGTDGEVEAIAGTTRDVTERKQAEEATRAGAERFRFLAESMPQNVGAVGIDNDERPVSGCRRSTQSPPMGSSIGALEKSAAASNVQRAVILWIDCCRVNDPPTRPLPIGWELSEPAARILQRRRSKPVREQKVSSSKALHSCNSGK
jgi:PAS domain-containing protein